MKILTRASTLAPFGADRHFRTYFPFNFDTIHVNRYVWFTFYGQIIWLSSGKKFVEFEQEKPVKNFSSLRGVPIKMVRLHKHVFQFFDNNSS